MRRLGLFAVPVIVVVLAGIYALVINAQTKDLGIDIGRAATTMSEPAAPSVYTQQSRFSVTPSNGFGSSAVAASGNTAVVYSGAGYYVYVRSGDVWSQQAILVPSDGLTPSSFKDIGIDGDTIVMGGAGATINGTVNRGAAYVFLRNGTVWTEQQRLTASDGVTGDGFGCSVAISGGTVIVGAYAAAPGGAVERGAAYVFVRNGSSWSEQVKFLADDGGARDNFGIRVAINGDSAVVTRAYRPSAAIPNPAAYVFVRSGTTWTQQQKLSVCEPSGSGGTQCAFGNSISIDGDNLAVGNYFLNVGSNSAQGGVYVFTRSGTAWTQQQRLTASDGGRDGLFGSAVSIANDTLLVGASADLGVPGSAYIYARTGSIWTQQQKIQIHTTRDAFGQYASMSGNTLLIACPVEQAAYVFVDPSITPTPSPTPAGFEADVAPRPNGDGNMLSTDITQLRRFVAGLDTPGGATNEFQRIDCAPRSTSGDGVVNSSDVVQGRRYASGLDPITASGGPTAPAFLDQKVSALFEDVYSYFVGREVRVGEAKVKASTVAVPVEITPHGNEVAVSFTIEYDDTKLANPRIILGDFAPAGSTLTLNINEPGRIGILIDSMGSMGVSGIPKSLLDITFDIPVGAGPTTSLTFSDALAQRGISDDRANLLRTIYRDRVVQIGAARK